LARGLLQVANPLLGQAPTPLGCLARFAVLCGNNDAECTELRVRKSQLRELYAIRQQQLDLEVANGVITVQQRFLDVGIARDVLESWEQRARVLDAQRESQQSNYQDLVEARLQRLQAKSDLWNKLMQLEIAHAQLRGSMGLLGEECATILAAGSQP
jgi:outer membrane protein TolC